MLTPHLITINSGEDVFREIMVFSQQTPRDICILSAVGHISTVTLNQPGSSARTVTHEGQFRILSLSGHFCPHESGGETLGRSGNMSIVFASPDGRVAGGTLAGMLVAATPVQVIVGSFVPYEIRSRPTAAVPVSAIPMSNLR
ncbi:AT-hook motif nuclear-localized protein 1 isoform X1 [Lotus japonicus]|uniref:AT-hook motif nuclear-localized protein 1 isoform X1 n=1 Tax=Lotus japonicus TaxID=34305 RepID=UPI002582D0FC|nr:AT-hook motif nuclear-localized protein 1 isoform X1 [Lotus japonicus]XP_057449875.1 AT-hook motif nuclear-localized protein 1 isoform X1 [Lotus japonicus]XP_057449876.1 AT-hook motif nuclear-localized protein 1 isoform X1 [Lotus japonicus]